MRNFEPELIGGAIKIFSPTVGLGKDELNALVEEQQDRECNLYTPKIQTSLIAFRNTIRETV